MPAPACARPWRPTHEPHHLPPTPDDALLKRHREANELDAARPGPALRENVLAHARAVAASRLETPPPHARPAANDSTWTWRALGSLTVIGLVGLLVLQFDRGTPGRVREDGNRLEHAIRGFSLSLTRRAAVEAPHRKLIELGKAGEFLDLSFTAKVGDGFIAVEPGVF